MPTGCNTRWPAHAPLPLAAGLAKRKWGPGSPAQREGRSGRRWQGGEAVLEAPVPSKPSWRRAAHTCCEAGWPQLLLMTPTCPPRCTHPHPLGGRQPPPHIFEVLGCLVDLQKEGEGAEACRSAQGSGKPGKMEHGGPRHLPPSSHRLGPRACSVLLAQVGCIERTPTPPSCYPCAVPETWRART